MMNDTELREELRAFYQEGGRQNGPCRDAEQTASYTRMLEEFQSVTAAHPEYSALRMRKETYRIITDHFRPVIFRNTPFYFEAGINGGWGNYPGKNWLQNHFREKIFRQEIPAKDLERFHARQNQKYILCCGPYVDAIHHLPPVTRILEDGFRSVYEEALAALPRCENAEEREFVETALAGLEAVRTIQRKFARRAEELLTSGKRSRRETRFLRMIADSAKRCPWEPPETFYEGLNTFWFLREIPALLDGLSAFSIGHPDAMLIDLYRKDLAEGRLTGEEASELIRQFLLIADCHYDSFSLVH